MKQDRVSSQLEPSSAWGAPNETKGPGASALGVTESCQMILIVIAIRRRRFVEAPASIAVFTESLAEGIRNSATKSAKSVEKHRHYLLRFLRLLWRLLHI